MEYFQTFCLNHCLSASYFSALSTEVQSGKLKQSEKSRIPIWYDTIHEPEFQTSNGDDQYFGGDFNEKQIENSQKA